MPVVEPARRTDWRDWCESAEGQGEAIRQEGWVQLNTSGWAYSSGTNSYYTMPSWTTTTGTNTNFTYTASSNTLGYDSVNWQPIAYPDPALRRERENQWNQDVAATVESHRQNERTRRAREAMQNEIYAEGIRLRGGVTTVGNSTVNVRQLTAEELATRDAEREASRVARASAESRAEELLYSLLPEEQARSYRLNGVFEVIGSCGNRYRVSRGVSGNIEWIRPDGKVGGRLCAHPTMNEHWLPTPDVNVGQLLALMHDEASFIRLANVHAGRRPPVPA